jgi:tetratricopeptide (TPR) repeat protein
MDWLLLKAGKSVSGFDWEITPAVRAMKFLKQQFSIGVLGWGILLSVGGLKANDNLAELVRHAASAMQKEDFAEAEKGYRAVLAQMPELHEIRSNLGVALHMQGKFEQAELEFRRVLRSSARLFVPNYFLGIQSFKTNRYSQARTFLEAAIAIQPADLQARQWLAATYAGLHHYHETIAQYREILKRDAQNVDSLYAIGRIFTELMERSFKTVLESSDSVHRGLLLLEGMGSTDEGRQLVSVELARLIQTSPTVPTLRLELGKLKLLDRQLEQSRTLFQEELTVDTWSFEARYGLAQVMLASGQYDGFADQLEEAIKVRPEFFCPLPPLWGKFLPSELESVLKHSLPPLAAGFLAAQLGRNQSFCQLLAHHKVGEVDKTRSARPEVLFREKRYEAVIETLEGLGSIARRDVPNRFLLAKSYFEVGRWEESAELANTLTSLPQVGLAAHYLLGKSYQELALGSFADLEKAAPDSYRAYQLLGEASLAKLDFSAAISAFETALKRMPNDSELHYQLGRALYAKSELVRALATVTRSLELDHHNAEANFLIGKILTDQNHYDQAGTFLKKALELDPSMMKAHAQLGKVYAQTDQWESAARHLELASTMDTDGGLYYQLFRAYSKLNQKAKAQEALTKSEKLRQAKLDHDRVRMTPSGTR